MVSFRHFAAGGAHCVDSAGVEHVLRLPGHVVDGGAEGFRAGSAALVGVLRVQAFKEGPGVGGADGRRPPVGALLLGVVDAPLVEVLAAGGEPTPPLRRPVSVPQAPGESCRGDHMVGVLFGAHSLFCELSRAAHSRTLTIRDSAHPPRRANSPAHQDAGLPLPSARITHPPATGAAGNPRHRHFAQLPSPQPRSTHKPQHTPHRVREKPLPPRCGKGRGGRNAACCWSGALRSVQYLGPVPKTPPQRGAWFD